MVVGFNHNFRYRGETYHVQTEDGGLKKPNIVTLLYKGGTILASKRTSYSDIARVDNLDQVVEDLMKEQHKEMLRRLKDGEYDHLLGGQTPAEEEVAVAGTPVVDSPADSATPVDPSAIPKPIPARPVTEPSSEPVSVSQSKISTPSRPQVANPQTVTRPLPEVKQPEPEKKQPEPEKKQPEPEKKQPEPAAEMELDDIILSYLAGDD